MSFSKALLFASMGNILAIALNYTLGYWLYEKSYTKLQKSRVGRKSFEYGSNYSYIVLLLSWLPLIGDPLTVVAGLLRLKFIYFLIIAGGLRVGRYYLISTLV